MFTVQINVLEFCIALTTFHLENFLLLIEVGIGFESEKQTLMSRTIK